MGPGELTFLTLFVAFMFAFILIEVLAWPKKKRPKCAKCKRVIDTKDQS